VASAALAAAALAINTAKAEATKVDVPFSFTAAGKSLPAGEYTVERDHLGSFLKLQAKDSPLCILAVASPTATDGKKVSLKFDNLGNTHVLQSIQYGNLITPRMDRKTKNREDLSSKDGSGQ